jgi:hypothetical protein
MAAINTGAVANLLRNFQKYKGAILIKKTVSILADGTLGAP